MKNNNIEYILKRIVYIAIIMYILDIILLGSGNLIHIGGISTRILFFAIAILFCIPGMLKNFKHYVTNKYCISVGIFMMFVVAEFVYGIYSGNSRTIMSTDFKGFLNILIVYPMIYALDKKEKMESLIKIMTGALMGVAVVALVLSFYMKFPEPIQKQVYSFFCGNKFCGIASLNSNVTRIFFHTAGRWFFIGFMFLLAWSVLKKEKRWAKEMGMAVFISGCLISYTRSIYLAIFICFIVFIVLVLGIFKSKAKQYFTSILRMSIMTVVIVIGLSLLQDDNLIQVAINRCLLATVNTEEFIENDVVEENQDSEVTTEEAKDSEVAIDETKDSNVVEEKKQDAVQIEKSLENKFNNAEAEIGNLEIRDLRKKIAIENIKKNPVLGNGLGVVNDINGEHIEYFYLDLISKMGIVGAVTLFIPFILCIYDFIRYRKRMLEENKLYLFSAIIGTLFLFVISYFNPCMNTNVGLAIYCLCMAMANVSQSEFKEEKI